METLCPECMGALVVSGETARCSVHGGEFRVLFLRQPAPPPMVPLEVGAGAAGMFCVQHPTVPAVRQCQSCGAYMCATCDFTLPGDIHLCPVCATKPQTELSGRRKKLRAWSFALAGWATLGMVALFGGAFAGMARDPAAKQALGSLLLFFILIPAIIGLSLGLAALDRRLANPLSLKLATVWSGVIVAIFVLLSAIGLMRR